MPLLANADYHIVAPDQRGFGRTTGWSNDYDRRIAKGNPFLREVLEDRTASALQEPEENTAAQPARPDRYNLS